MYVCMYVCMYVYIYIYTKTDYILIFFSLDPSPLLIAALIKLNVIDSSTKDKLDVSLTTVFVL